MKLNDLKSKNRARKARRAGRGIASGLGKTAGKGTKGQKSRSGFNLPLRFEGGQTSFIQRMPKVQGIRSKTIKPKIVKISVLETEFDQDQVISPETLQNQKIIYKLNRHQKVKILFDKPINKIFKFKDCLLSRKVRKYTKE